jgi:FkbM family methyltransferase
MIRVELKSLTLSGRPLKFTASPQATASIRSLLQRWHDYLTSAAGMPPFTGDGDLHIQIVRFLESVAAVSPPHPAAEKCREHFEYFAGKCAEFGTNFTTWNDGIRLTGRRASEGALVLDVVVGETIDHLLNLAAEAVPSVGARAGLPVQFIRSEDDSRKQRGYFYFGNDLAMVETHFDSHLLLDLQDLSLTPTILKTGWWEPWIDILLRSLLRPGMTYINAGANVGYHTALGGKLVGSSGKVFSFEANPHAYALLRKGVYFNGFFDRTAMFAAAAYDTNGAAEFRYVREMLGGGGIDPSGPAQAPAIRDRNHPLRERFTYRPEDFKVFDTPTVTLDDAVGVEADTIDLLHMDIEGAEGPALLGARQLIARSPNLRMIIEWSYKGVDYPEVRKKFEMAVEMLAAQGFTYYVIEPPPNGANLYITPPNLRRIERSALFDLEHCDLFITKQAT